MVYIQHNPPTISLNIYVFFLNQQSISRGLFYQQSIAYRISIITENQLYLTHVIHLILFHFKIERMSRNRLRRNFFYPITFLRELHTIIYITGQFYSYILPFRGYCFLMCGQYDGGGQSHLVNPNRVFQITIADYYFSFTPFFCRIGFGNKGILGCLQCTRSGGFFNPVNLRLYRYLNIMLYFYSKCPSIGIQLHFI